MDSQKNFCSYFENPAEIPVSFTYNNVKLSGFGTFSQTSRCEKTEGAKKTVTVEFLHPDKRLAATVEMAFYEKYNAFEWTVWFKNISDKNTSVLKDIAAADLRFKDKANPGKNTRLKGILGDHAHQFKPYCVAPFGISFTSNYGRPSHYWSPYFNLETEDGGIMMAIGWQGSWKASFDVDVLSMDLLFKAYGTVGFEAYLKPKEAVRTPLMAFVLYDERNEDVAVNAWRKWYVDCNIPKADHKGNPIEPFTTACFQSDIAQRPPQSDGSVCENFKTWKPTAEKILNEKIRLDYRWFDAGWYLSPENKSLKTEWELTGSLTLDPSKWPDNTLKESSEYLKNHGIKTFMWFEPERLRVEDPEAFEAFFGFKKDWIIQIDGQHCIADLSNPDCFDWTLNRIISVMDENAIDLYREDFNECRLSAAWAIKDRDEGENRIGITENLYIQAHMKLWDSIIEYCKNNGKCTFVDSCASGGGRLDLESMRRAVPILRSDSDRTTIALRLSMTTAFCKWIPFNGASLGEKGELESTVSFDQYDARGSYLPVIGLNLEFQNPDLPYDLLRKSIAEWEKVSPFMTKDFYVLTPWRSKNDTECFTAFMFMDAQKGVLFIFRGENSPQKEITLSLKGLRDEKMYKLTDADDPQNPAVLKGDTLIRGSLFKLENPRSSSIIFIEEI